MSVRVRNARAPIAPGRFLVFVLLLATGGCQLVAGRFGGGAPIGLATEETVIVEPGSISRAEQSEAARLWFTAQRRFRAGDLEEVLAVTDQIVARYPESTVSGQALRLNAEAAAQLGSAERADAAAERYIGLLDDLDPRAAPMRLLQARVLAQDRGAVLNRLLRMDEGADAESVAEAVAMLRALYPGFSPQEIQAELYAVSSRGPVTPFIEAWLAVDLLEDGEAQVARSYARSALESGVSGEDRALAEGVLAGDLPEGRGRTYALQIGVVLPTSGPPALAEFANLVAEGIELAAATALPEAYQVTTLELDDEGDASRSAQRVRELETGPVVGIVGFLRDESLLSAGAARGRGTTLVSPTARSASRAGGGVFSLEGADPEAARAVARYAASRAFQRVAIVHPDTPEALAEADAFEVTAARLGVPVVGRFEYEAGAMFFEAPILEARDALRQEEIRSLGLTQDDTLHAEVLEPVALFLPIPPEDVEFLAPQLIHFGLDTLAIELLGTSGWSDPQSLAAVDSRVTTGIVATAPVEAQVGDLTGGEAFAQLYEAYFQRSLVSPAPALGYDAMLLLLESLRPGRVRSDEVRASFEALADVQGATGVFSVVDGRIVRRTQLVRIDDRIPVPIEVR